MADVTVLPRHTPIALCNHKRSMDTLCVSVCVCMHLSAAAILACLFDQPIKPLRRGQIAWTNTLSLLCSFFLTHIKHHVDTLWCVATSLPSSSEDFEEYCAVPQLYLTAVVNTSVSVYLFTFLHLKLCCTES